MIRVPALAAIREALRERDKAVAEAAAAMEKVMDLVVTASIQIGCDPNEKIGLIRHLYWQYPDVQVKWIAAAFGINVSEVCGIAGPAQSDLSCNSCGTPILKKSRTERVGNLCETCQSKYSEINERLSESRRQSAQKRLNELRTMPYRDYLKSPEWIERRKEHLKRAGYSCQVCNASRVELHVHHRTYERRGNERFADLIVLCKGCHGIFHSEGKLASWSNK